MAKRKPTPKTSFDYDYLITKLNDARIEEEVVTAYQNHFGLEGDKRDKHDFYTEQVLYEFKLDEALAEPEGRARVLAQALYYVRKLCNGDIEEKTPPPYICLIDKNEAILTKRSVWRDFYENNAYDWDLAPSNPDPKLCKNLAKNQDLKNLIVWDITEFAEYSAFAKQLNKIYAGELELTEADKLPITEENFETVFDLWNKRFGEDVRNGFKSSRYFVADIQEGNSIVVEREGKILFRLADGDYRPKKIVFEDYQKFWLLYERVTNPDTLRAIIAKTDRLTDDFQRRFHGEFFTPLPFAKKALDYLTQTLGKKWWATGEYRLWDMAAGSGNLEYHLSAEAYPYCYLSTLYKEDVEHLQRVFHGPTVFQYDYLNDDITNVFRANGEIDFGITWKLPEKLRNDLQNPKIKWIILINPPFATASMAGTDATNKMGASDTKARAVMHQKDLGETSRELFSQFLFRINREFKDKNAYLGLFSKLKYINANNDQKLRETIFRYKYEKGFMFSSANFSGTSKTSQFPVGFLIWNLTKIINIDQQKIILDVLDNQAQKTNTKRIETKDRGLFLGKWIKRPRGVKKYPPFSGGITIKKGTKDVRDRISNDFLGALMCVGSDLQHQNFTALLSGPYVSAGGHSITPEIFEQSMVVHTVRRLPKATWLNDRDIFMQPSQDLPQSFINDAVIWSLFSNSNQTVAMRDVKYLGEIYQIPCHFFPFSIEKIKSWKPTDSDIMLQLATAKERFVCTWLAKQNLSPEAKAVLDAGENVYQFYFENIHRLATKKFEIETWDAGFWQIRNALNAKKSGENELDNLKQAHNALREKLLPQIYELGFLV